MLLIIFPQLMCSDLLLLSSYGNLNWEDLEQYEFEFHMHSDIQDGSAPDVMEALQNGYSYLWKPSEQYNRRAFNIINVDVNDTYVELTIDNEENVDEIRWRTHNPITDETETVHYGNRIRMADIPEYSLFVRAEIEGSEGTIYTQPFYVTDRNGSN